MSDWKLLRLELARTPGFPHGSASRGYLLRLPLDDEGLIDPASLSQHPDYATVRRFWPEEPDQSGYLVRKGRGWAFSYALGDEDDEAVYHLGDHPLLHGNYLTLTEPDGDTLPYRVASSEFDSYAAA